MALSNQYTDIVMGKKLTVVLNDMQYTILMKALEITGMSMHGFCKKAIIEKAEEVVKNAKKT